MADILPRDLPAAGPIDAGNDVIIIQQTGTVRKTSPSDIVNETNPVATEAEAQAGTDNAKRMTPLRVKQSIAAEAGTTIATYAQGQLADSAVQPSLVISAGDGLTGGGTLSENRTIALNSTSLASLALADSAVQPGDLATVATTGSYTDLIDTPPLGALATKDQIVVADIDATGTPDVNTYLRGDGTWSAGGGGGRVDSVSAGSGISVDSSDPVVPVVSMEGALKAKLDGIQAGATANQTDAYLLNRANHTGTQEISTVSGLQAALDDKATAAQGAKADNAVQFVSQTLTPEQQEQAQSNIGLARTQTIESLGAVGDGVTDDTAAFAAAFASSIPTILQSGKTYLVNPVALPLGDGFEMKTSGAGKATVRLTNGNGKTILSYGDTDTPVATTTLSATATIRRKKITLADASGIVPGMLIKIISNQNWAHDETRRKGEIHLVNQVMGNDVWVAASLAETYDVSTETVTVTAHNSCRVHVENIEFVTDPGQTNTFGLMINYMNGSVFRDCIFKGFSYIGLAIKNSYRTLVDNCGFQDTGEGGILGYGSVSYGCFGTHYRDCWAENCRKMADFSSLSSTAIERQVLVTNPHINGFLDDQGLEDVESLTGLGAHEGCDGLTIRGGTISNVRYGVNSRGRNIIVENVEFIGRMEACVRVYEGSNLTVRDCSANEDYRPDKVGTAAQVPQRFIQLNNHFYGYVTAIGNRGRVAQEFLYEYYTTPAGVMPDRTLKNNEIKFYNEDTGFIPVALRAYNAKSATNLVIADNTFSRETTPGVMGPWQYTQNITPQNGISTPDVRHVRVANGAVGRIYPGTATSRILCLITTPTNNFQGGMAVLVAAGGGGMIPVTAAVTGFAWADSVPTGTTGPDGSINLRYEDGVIYVENRSGSTKYVSITIIQPLALL